MPVKAFVVRKGEVGTVVGIPEGREGIALVTQRIADNVSTFFSLRSGCGFVFY